ncbi:hypothetical protein LXL04_016910 [Taraxacum kok-saghyz]
MGLPVMIVVDGGAMQKSKVTLAKAIKPILIWGNTKVFWEDVALDVGSSTGRLREVEEETLVVNRNKQKFGGTAPDNGPDGMELFLPAAFQMAVFTAGIGNGTAASSGKIQRQADAAV